MSWLSSILATILAAGVALVAGGFIADKCVRWYSISSREGNSGYFVVFIALISGVAALPLGLFASRIALAATHQTWASLVAPLAMVLLAAPVALWIAHARADIPPEINGKPLKLEIEFRSPPASVAPMPATDDSFELISLPSYSRTARARTQGQIHWTSLKRQEDRWLLTCSADLFTRRGKRVVLIHLGKLNEGFEIPVPATPDPDFLNWSSWLPRQRPDGQPQVNTLTYRFRVMPLNPGDQP